MTRKHFEALAAALRSNAPSSDSSSYEAELFESLVKAVAGACERSNPRFNHRRFAEASGLDMIRDWRGLPLTENTSSARYIEQAA